MWQPINIIVSFSQIAAEVAAPLARTEEIVLLGGSDSTSGELTRLVGQVPPAVHALTGVDLSKVSPSAPFFFYFSFTFRAWFGFSKQCGTRAKRHGEPVSPDDAYVSANERCGPSFLINAVIRFLGIRENSRREVIPDSRWEQRRPDEQTWSRCWEEGAKSVLPKVSLLLYYLATTLSAFFSFPNFALPQVLAEVAPRANGHACHSLSRPYYKSVRVVCVSLGRSLLW